MAPAPSRGDVTLNDALDAITGGTLKVRGTGLDDLIFLLDEKKAKTANLSILADKHYHRIFEALFRCAITEKQSYYSGKKTTAASAATRLSKCAEALRLALNHGASKLKRKTVLAVIDHITQTLPGPDNNSHEMVEPLLQNYDEMLNSVRDEMLKTIFAIHLHLERLLQDGEDLSIQGDVEDLFDTLWLEYTRRNEQSQLHIDDISFTITTPDDFFRLRSFGLRPHNQDGEGKWATLQVLAFLEKALYIAQAPRQSQHEIGTEELEQPRKKKRRVDAANDRLQGRLKSPSTGVRRATLQLIPFLLDLDFISAQEVLNLHTEMLSFLGETGGTASWAMLAYSCVAEGLGKGHEDSASTWRPVWQLSARAVSLPATCRAACHLMRSILVLEMLTYHSVSDEITSIVTTADVNGPAILVDSSMALMLQLILLRGVKLPNQNQSTSHHVIRWVFLRWKPADMAFASLHSAHVHPAELANLFRACCGTEMLPIQSRPVSGSTISQAWSAYQQTAPVTSFLLLLSSTASTAKDHYRASQDNSIVLAHDSTNVHATQRLILELLFPKIEELQELCRSWGKREGGSQMSLEKLQSLFSACVVGTLLIPQLEQLNSRQSRDIEAATFTLLDSTLDAVLSAPENQAFFELLLGETSLHIPALTTTELGKFALHCPYLLRLLSRCAVTLRQRSAREPSGRNVDFMDLDDEFDSQESGTSNSVKIPDVPRRSEALQWNSEAFYLSTALRLYFLEAIDQDREKIGFVPEPFFQQLSSLSRQDFLLSTAVTSEIFNSDFTIKPDEALVIVEKLGEMIGETEYTCCETVHSMSLSIIKGLLRVWSDSKHDVATFVGDLYHYFVKASLPKNSLSPRSQIALAELLFCLLREDPQYGSSLGLSPCRTTLLSILQQGSMTVKYFIAMRLPEIFALYVLKAHDEVFLDVLESLPTDPGQIEGIGFRILVLSELACRWPTLLRRCTYHIFETPGKIKQSSQYATRCLAKVSTALQLESPKELFKIFSPQLFYTWLDGDELEEMPFEIFGFTSLEDMLERAQSEAAALMLMRGQEESTARLAQRLLITPATMIKQGFSKIAAYAMAHDTSAGNSITTAESRIRKTLGKEPYLDAIYANFVDIIAVFFDVFDQEDPMDKYFGKDENFAYAAIAMSEMKSFSHSDVTLPANQQPMFKGKHLLRQLFHLCNRTEYELQSIWTPALVVCVARRLFNTVHPALGSLHACSVLRKVRVLICLAGPTALDVYALEMLLHSIRPFIVDSECADDALGVTQYLISKGAEHLEQSPSFLAGYALSTLASLRVFLESSQSSTTQESQFKATMSKAQRFHAWFSNFLAQYDSPSFKSQDQKDSFKSITQSASNIRTSGNAESGTHESTLLLEILKDDDREQKLLNEAARDLALGLLCGDFVIPPSARYDVISDDEKALHHGGLVLKSCKTQALSNEYLAWAGRVVGRAFAASGEIEPELLRESQLSSSLKLAPGANGSERGLFTLLQQLTVSKESFTAGLAESALRAVVSEAAAEEDELLTTAAQKTLPEPLYLASTWQPYRTPPSDTASQLVQQNDFSFTMEDIEDAGWIRKLVTYLVQAVPEFIILSELLPILTHVKGFAEKALPFILHLALCGQMEKQQSARKHLSDALKEWLSVSSESSHHNQKHLLNALLYLRTQPLPNESSIADRAGWLDVDFSSAAGAASRCGMHKTALLFFEVAASQVTRASRRSSALRESHTPSVLLSIFENIDDPDAYYGLPQTSSLSNVMARLEYENDGFKSLAFRGAQFDSHIQSKSPASQNDGLSMVKALSTLGLSGLSHALLQTQSLVENTNALESTFGTARRLEIWNLPAPNSSENHAVSVYKAFQSIHQANDSSAIRQAIYDGFGRTMASLTSRGLNAANLRHHLGALAVLTELDDVVNVADFGELEALLDRFENHGEWMKRGRYDDVSQLLSSRGTTLSLLSQQPKLRAAANLSTSQARQIEVRCKLTSSGIYRFHRATQESLNISTSLTNLIVPSEDLGLSFDAAAKIESANSLWDHGEMVSSIRMLQSIDNDSVFKKQSIPVSRSDLLSKIGYQISVAKLEKPHDIQKKYLEPALKELKGRTDGKDAGKVFHQFAMFCDEQLQNSDGLDDLARLQNLRKGKSDEVAQLRSLISSEKNSQTKSRYSSHLTRAQQWLHLDEQELRRVEQTRSEFVRLSLENYLLSLIASDEHNNDALRFTALWLERSDDDSTNDAVRRHLDKVPTRKFATLMNQLCSRLQDQSNVFQRLLINLVYNICIDHPYHSMYQVWSGVKVKANSKDEVAVLRHKATNKVKDQLEKHPTQGAIWHAIDRTNGHYHRLAVDRDNPKYKAGHKINLKETTSGNYLVAALNKYQIPPPTMQLELSADKDYSKVPIIANLEPQMSIASGVSAPKIITAVGTDGVRYKQLVKGGNDDLRQDAIMEQVFAAVSSLLKLHRETQRRNLGIRTYKVLPLTSASGLIEFVPNTIPLHEFLMPAHERYYPKDLKGSQCRKEISAVQGKSVDARVSAYRKVKERFHPVMKYFFMEYFVDPDEWFVKRTAYTRTTAAISMLGHILGLGDRHGHNILLDNKTGEVVHIDLGVAFEMGRVLPVPELVPFRLTRDIEDGMGVTKEGVFQRCCEFTLDALREETYSIMTILDVLRYDPLYSWSISPVRLAKLQGGSGDGDDDVAGRGKTRVNEPSEADRALEVVRKKLSKTLSVTATVNDLINQATDERNLAVLYSGWAAYA
ncbi:hypothetical protein VdG1_07050 [Verticillium dahliae VDG1]|nr:hypothetical protein VdG1_07050 [Verticillium dahliae VDG1]